MLRSIDVVAHAGTAFDGQHLFQLAEDRVQKIDPKSGRVIATIPSPGGGDSGLACGRRDALGRAVSNARSIKSILKQERFFARSSQTVSSPGSPGSTESSGTVLGR